MIGSLLLLTLAAEPLDPAIRYTQGSGAYTICGVSADNPNKLIETVMALPGLQRLEEKAQYLTFVQDDERRFWTFTINDHPAAPAIICRTIAETLGGGAELTMEISCFADKASCDQLAEDFAAHDRRIIKGMGQ